MINTTRLYPSKLFHLSIGIVFGAVTFISAGLLLADKITPSFISIFIIVVFALTSFFTIANVTFINRVYLQVDADGITISTLFNSSYVQWRKIEGFFIIPSMNETPEQLRILLLDDTSADFDRNKQEGVSRQKSSVHNLEKSIVVTYCYGKSNLTDLAMFLDTHLQLYRRANNAKNQCAS